MPTLWPKFRPEERGRGDADSVAIAVSVTVCSGLETRFEVYDVIKDVSDVTGEPMIVLLPGKPFEVDPAAKDASLL